MKIKNFILTATIVLSSLVSTTVSASGFKQTMSARENTVISMNMLPTQFQAVVIDLTKVDPEKTDVEDVVKKLKNIATFNGNVIDFLAGQDELLNEIDVSISSKGSEFMTVNELRNLQKSPKNITFDVEKKNKSASFIIKYNDPEQGFTTSGTASLNKGMLIDKKTHIVLISYRMFK